MRTPTRSLSSALALLCAAALGGCLLAEEDCGRGFTLVGNRCVAAVTPTVNADRGESPPIVVDAGIFPDADIVSETPPGTWAPYVIIALLDRTPADAVDRSPTTPGTDLDAILVLARDGDDVRTIGRGAALVDSPELDPRAVVGEADGIAASLGDGGGRVFVQLGLDRPLTSGDAVVVHELDERGGERDAYAIFACRAPLNPMDGCRQLGTGGRGVSVFLLP